MHLDVCNNDVASSAERIPYHFKLVNGRDIVADQRGEDVVVIDVSGFPDIRDVSHGLRAERGEWVGVLVEEGDFFRVGAANRHESALVGVVLEGGAECHGWFWIG